MREIMNAQGIKDENILYLLLEKVYFPMIKDGTKDIEYRTFTKSNLAKLYKLDPKSGKRSPKPITHVLLQGGYSVHARRMLIECDGWWVKGGLEYPAGANFRATREIAEDEINIALGKKILYDSDDYTPHQNKPEPKRQSTRIVEKVEVSAPAKVKPVHTVEVCYKQTGKSMMMDEMGMREMQARVYGHRSAQHLLLKAPPASGKSRALMFIALDKLVHQGLKKAIVAVPERAIGASFKSTNLTDYGFFADWEIKDKYNLCLTSGNKVDTFIEFLESEERILLCTHSTLRYAFEKLQPSDFDNILVAVDEFHHVSSDADSKLGEVVMTLMKQSSAHLFAMTGSYFRGDNVAVIAPELEQMMTKVTYTYYDQLNGYKWLKNLTLSYNFYSGRYFEPDESGLSALEQVIDDDKKTIIHIPHIGSAESSGVQGKHEEVSHIQEALGEYLGQDEDTQVISIKSKKNGRILKVIDLVEDDPKKRDKAVAYLRRINSKDDLDFIIALGMAKEGFDWPYCEVALTIGYRGSLTEVVQIIGRATRDSEGKSHAQFINLVAAPNAESEEVNSSVNNMIKAITASLLMEQVMAPKFKFVPRDEAELDLDEDDYETATTKEVNPEIEVVPIAPESGTVIKVGGMLGNISERVKDITDNEMTELRAYGLQHPAMIQAIKSQAEPEVINSEVWPKIIKEYDTTLSAEEGLAVAEQVVLEQSITQDNFVESSDGRKFVKMGNRFANIMDLHIDMIMAINPFQKDFAVLSKYINPQLLRSFRDSFNAMMSDMSDEEAIALIGPLQEFVKRVGKEPDLSSTNREEQKLAVALAQIRVLAAQRKQMKETEEEYGLE